MSTPRPRRHLQSKEGVCLLEFVVRLAHEVRLVGEREMQGEDKLNRGMLSDMRVQT
jgi:hypothetical protein